MLTVAPRIFFLPSARKLPPGKSRKSGENKNGTCDIREPSSGLCKERGVAELGQAMRNFFRTQKSRVHPRIFCIF